MKLILLIIIVFLLLQSVRSKAGILSKRDMNLIEECTLHQQTLDSILSTFCEVNSCKNKSCNCNGVCEAGVCKCHQGFGGENCEDDLRCDCVTCVNNGECKEGKCICPENFSGDACEVFDDPCHGVICNNRGTCENGIPCKCEPGFTGDYCEDIDDCVDNPCENGGVCIDGNNSTTCRCPPRNYGRFCEYYCNDVEIITVEGVAIDLTKLQTKQIENINSSDECMSNCIEDCTGYDYNVSYFECSLFYYPVIEVRSFDYSNDYYGWEEEDGFWRRSGPRFEMPTCTDACYQNRLCLTAFTHDNKCYLFAERLSSLPTYEYNNFYNEDNFNLEEEIRICFIQ